MNVNHIKVHPWKIIEETFNPKRVEAAESIFSLGNGAMGQRANFEEQYSGNSFQGSYVAGVFYPDKTKVGWWKNGYPEYFAKVLNAPNWIGIDLKCNNETVDINNATVHHFRRELDMKSGLYTRSVTLSTANGIKLTLTSERFLAMFQEELGCIRYAVQLHDQKATISLTPYIDAHIKNKDSNWDDPFWKCTGQFANGNFAALHTRTNKSEFDVCTYQAVTFSVDDNWSDAFSCEEKEGRIAFTHQVDLEAGQKLTVEKMGGYCSSLQQPAKDQQKHVFTIAQHALEKGFDTLLETQKTHWNDIWRMADITIDGDVKAQQGIRFNIFHLNQT